MLAACANSPSKPPPQRTPDPIIETRTEVRTVCPPEVTAPLGTRPEPAAGAELTGNDLGMAWLGAILSRLGLVEGRVHDAAEACK